MLAGVVESCVSQLCSSVSRAMIRRVIGEEQSVYNAISLAGSECLFDLFIGQHHADLRGYFDVP